MVTTSDLACDVNEIDFVYCTIVETTRATVKLTNKSILCQPFGFINLPEVIYISNKNICSLERLIKTTYFIV